MTMGTREGTVTILLIVSCLMLVAVFGAYKLHMPDNVCTVVLSSFTGAFGALMLALNGSSKPPTPPNA